MIREVCKQNAVCRQPIWIPALQHPLSCRATIAAHLTGPLQKPECPMKKSGNRFIKRYAIACQNQDKADHWKCQLIENQFFESVYVFFSIRRRRHKIKIASKRRHKVCIAERIHRESRYFFPFPAIRPVNSAKAVVTGKSAVFTADVLSFRCQDVK